MNKDNSLLNRIKEFDLKNVVMVLSVLALIVVVLYVIIRFGIIPFWGVLEKLLKGVANG